MTSKDAKAGDALRLAVAAMAQELPVEQAALLAVVEVESGGRIGARVAGRMEPLIRFEGHYFYRLLPAAKRNRALASGLAHPVAGKVRNPLRQSARWRLLEAASAIDRPAALASASWGVGQVMGAHWRWLGYGDIEAMVADVRAGIEGQVRLMARFISEAGLAERLQAHDWRGFARAYNGPAYRSNRYDERMAQAYARIVGERPERPARNAMAMLALGAGGPAVEALQRDLRLLGYPLIADGDFGSATQAALRQFQLQNGLRPDGVYGARSMEAMGRRMPPAALSA